MMIKINEAFISETSDEAKTSPRLRKNYNFHKEYSATLQRMLNAMEPNTYIQPHKHEDPDKVEVFFVLRGRILLVEFDDNGAIRDHIILDPKQGDYGAEVPIGVWHSLISLEKGSVAYEVKDGPYTIIDDKNFASWAPKEGDDGCQEFNNKILAKLGIEKPAFV